MVEEVFAVALRDIYPLDTFTDIFIQSERTHNAVGKEHNGRSSHNW